LFVRHKIKLITDRLIAVLIFFAKKASLTVSNTDAGITITSTLRYSFDKDLNKALLSCDVLHPLVNQSDLVNLDVVYAPIVSLDRSVYQVRENNELQIACNVEANPPAKYTYWYRRESKCLCDSSDLPRILTVLDWLVQLPTLCSVRTASCIWSTCRKR
jgi:hypothetical protein